jgi:hypothetical protein
MSVPAWVRPGARCVCVDDADQQFWSLGRVVRGETYTVAGIADVDDNGQAGLILAEVKTGQECYNLGFRAARFRPTAVTGKTEAQDLAHFSHHLDQKLPVAV